MDKDKMMMDLIISWGLPKCLEEFKKDIIFKFDNDNLLGTEEKNYHCKDEDVKFCLYNKRLEKVLFSMDFFQANHKFSNFPTPRIVLELLFTHDSALRRKGIASYYIARLREYALFQKVKCIFITAIADADNFKHDNKYNSLEQKELEAFYERRSTEEMPIQIFTLTS